MTGGSRLRISVILAGGEGRRMGGRKPFRRFGDTTLIARAEARARCYGAVVGIAARRPDQAPTFPGTSLLLDDPAIEGPLAGLAAALAFADRLGADHVLTLPCDMPLLPDNLRLRLQAALDEGGAAGGRVAVATSGGRLHPVCALWPTDAGADLRTYVASGRRSLKGLAAILGVIPVPWPTGPHDPFANANTAEELEALLPVG
ncbi:MAG: molybdenum cofactor guanylyltransferase [Caulobacter sp.]|nr:molybdenum cofactor guanylyltransferase [Caulobacter sp.]